METITESRPPRALEDPSGRRLRRMRWLGRIVAVLFLVWFAAIVLGALGVGPAGRVPFGNALRPSAGPPPLRRLPSPRRPARSDLVPALPATVLAPAVLSPLKDRATHGQSASAPGHATVTGTAPGHSASAPGHATVTGTAPGHSASAPGHATVTGSAPGHSASAPGHATTTAPGRSESTPGHVTTKVPRRSSSTFGHLRTHSAVAPGSRRDAGTVATTTAATTTTATTTTPRRGRAGANTR
jgi:hypothetical protein